MGSPLSASELQSVLSALLSSSTDQGSSSSSSDSSTSTASVAVPNAATAVYLLSHAIHTSLGFRQVKPVPSGELNSSNDAKVRNSLAGTDRREWLARNADEESFATSYRHEQSSFLFEVRIARLGARIVVNAVAVEVRWNRTTRMTDDASSQVVPFAYAIIAPPMHQDNKTATLDIVGKDYLSTSAFPATLDISSPSLEGSFNSPARFTDFIADYRTQIIQRLIPGLAKPGYEETASSTSTAAGNANNAPAAGNAGRPYRPAGVPFADPDDYDAREQGRIGAYPRFPMAGPGQNPLEVGRSDLDPLGGAVGRLPGAGGDGMLVGPGHPLFNREREGNDPLRIPGTGGQGARGPWGGDGFLPPLGAPPGARFDPVGPFGGPGQPMGPGRGGRNWGDELPPPVGILLRGRDPCQRH